MLKKLLISLALSSTISISYANEKVFLPGRIDCDEDNKPQKCVIYGWNPQYWVIEDVLLPKGSYYLKQQTIEASYKDRASWSVNVVYIRNNHDGRGKAIKIHSNVNLKVFDKDPGNNWIINIDRGLCKVAHNNDNPICNFEVA